jgi:hypothetical protein
VHVVLPVSFIAHSGDFARDWTYEWCPRPLEMNCTGVECHVASINALMVAWRDTRGDVATPAVTPQPQTPGAGP